MGLRDDETFQKAYWKYFEEFFGKQNSAVVKAMLLAKNSKAETGAGEVDRVCLGLRQTMGWLAEAIERKALTAVGPRKGAPFTAPRAPNKQSTEAPIARL